jgi:hypothetical protein
MLQCHGFLSVKTADKNEYFESMRKRQKYAGYGLKYQLHMPVERFYSDCLEGVLVLRDLVC